MFAAKEVKRAIRDFNNAAEDVLQATLYSYQSCVNRFISLTQGDPVIRHITQPLFEKQVNENEIHRQHELKLPIEVEDRLAYALQVLLRSYQGEYTMDQLATSIFFQRNISDNLSLFNNDVLRPCFRDLANCLSDMVEDRLDGSDEVPTSALQIFNVGPITAHKGAQVAVGTHISQEITSSNTVEHIVKRAIEEGLVAESERSKLDGLIEQLHAELDTSAPSPSRLKGIVTDLYKLGQQSLLAFVNGVAGNPSLTSAVAEFLLHMH